MIIPNVNSTDKVGLFKLKVWQTINDVEPQLMHLYKLKAVDQMSADGSKADVTSAPKRKRARESSTNQRSGKIKVADIVNLNSDKDEEERDEDDEHQNEDRDEDTDGNVCAETSRASRVLDYDDDDGYMILDNDDKTLRDYGVKAESTIWVRPVPKGGTVNGKSMESFFFYSSDGDSIRASKSGHAREKGFENTIFYSAPVARRTTAGTTEEIVVDDSEEQTMTVDEAPTSAVGDTDNGNGTVSYSL